MPILLALSVVAFVALLWATVSIVTLVRRARRGRRERFPAVSDAGVRKAIPLPAEPVPLVYPDQGASIAKPRASITKALSSRPLPDGIETALSETRDLEFAASETPVPRRNVPPPPVPAPNAQTQLRNFPTRLSKHTLATPGSDDNHAGWNPFGKDFANLSDPAPSRGHPAARKRPQ